MEVAQRVRRWIPPLCQELRRIWDLTPFISHQASLTQVHGCWQETLNSWVRRQGQVDTYSISTCIDSLSLNSYMGGGSSDISTEVGCFRRGTVNSETLNCLYPI